MCILSAAGKAAKKLQRAQKKALKQAVASGEGDVDMTEVADASLDA